MRIRCYLLTLGIGLLAWLGCGKSSDPLVAAAGAGDSTLVERLLGEGDDPNRRDRGANALAAAARGGHQAAMRLLLRAGAGPDRPSGHNGWTPLMHAIHKNQAASISTLLNGGANVNVTCCGGQTALMMAAGYGQTGLVNLLLDRGADPRLQALYGLSALDLAITGVADIDAWTLGSCQTATVKALLDRAPDMARQASFQSRAARWMSRPAKCADVMRLLEEPRARRM